MKRGKQLLSSLLLLVTVSIHTSKGQEQGGPAVEDHWVWGQRSAAASLPHAIGAVGAAAIVPPPNGRGRSLGITNGLQQRLGRVLGGDTQDRTEFKSITARSYPTVSQPNALGVTQEAKLFTKPSSVQKKLFGSHAQLDVFPGQTFQPKEFGGRIDGPNSEDPSTQLSLITAGEFPYPFGSNPIDLGDGTSIGWVPQDTLFVSNNPNSGSNAHSANQFNLPSIGDDQDARYTTLDKLFDTRTPTKLPDPHSLPNDVLGGLHPDEVYYADKDLVIIKGGGFTSGPFEKPSNLDEIEKESENNSIKESLHGNELGEANDIRLVNVRPDELFSKVPLPYRFVNGNIPTIVHPNSRQAQFNRHQRTATSDPPVQHGFRPFHQTSFTPIAPQARRAHSFIPLQSQQLQTYSAGPVEIANMQGIDGRYQRLNEEEIMEAEPSVVSVQRMLPPVKRSADSSVVSYHFQSRGSGASAHPIVDYKLHREDSAGSASNSHPALARVQDNQPNSIQLPHKGNLEGELKHRQQRPSSGQPNSNTFDNLEDLSIPEGANALIPQLQTPRERPSFHQAPQGSGPQGSSTGSHFSSFVPQPQPPHQFSPRDPNNFAPPKPGANLPPISLEGDTLVNFLPPLPPIHSQAEFLGSRRQQQQPPQGVPASQGSNPNIVRGVRLDTRQQGQGRQPPQRTGVTRRAAGNRFMEPRRRVPFRPRQGPPRV